MKRNGDKESFWLLDGRIVTRSQDENKLEQETSTSAIKEFIDDEFYSNLVDKIKMEVNPFQAKHNLDKTFRALPTRLIIRRIIGCS